MPDINEIISELEEVTALLTIRNAQSVSKGMDKLLSIKKELDTCKNCGKNTGYYNIECPHCGEQHWITKMNMKKVLEQLEDMERMLMNRLWVEGGNELIDEFLEDVKTCKHCGHKCDNVVQCPVCGKNKNEF